jgi:formate hydrogenlyase subunit 2
VNRFVIADSTVCIGCRTCEAACSETHRQHGLQAMPRLQVMRNEKESAPQMCHHCEDAPAPPSARLTPSIASMARSSSTRACA